MIDLGLRSSSMMRCSPGTFQPVSTISTMAWSMMSEGHLMSEGVALVARRTVPQPVRRPMADASVVMLDADQKLVCLARIDVTCAGRYRAGYESHRRRENA